MPRRSMTIDDENVKADSLPKTKAELRQEALNGVLQVGQLACLTFGQFADAGAIGMHGPKLADEIVQLAENNSKIASKVDLLIEVGPYAGIVAATIPFLAQLFVNHGIIKAETFANAGVVEPSQLEQEMKLVIMRRSLEVQRQQQQMEQELRDAMNEMNGQEPANAE